MSKLLYIKEGLARFLQSQTRIPLRLWTQEEVQSGEPAMRRKGYAKSYMHGLKVSYHSY